jgi:hypothetical protein
MQRARRLDRRLFESIGGSEPASGELCWSRTLRMLFLAAATIATWVVPLLLIDLLAF